MTEELEVLQGFRSQSKPSLSGWAGVCVRPARLRGLVKISHLEHLEKVVGREGEGGCGEGERRARQGG